MCLPTKGPNQVQDSRPMFRQGKSRRPQTSQTSAVQLECTLSGLRLFSRPEMPHIFLISVGEAHSQVSHVLADS